MFTFPILCLKSVSLWYSLLETIVIWIQRAGVSCCPLNGIVDFRERFRKSKQILKVLFQFNLHSMLLSSISQTKKFKVF